MDKVCVRCGASSTPLWRPEVLAGPKVLCNACGVKLMYSNRGKRLRLEGPMSNHQPRQCQGSAQRANDFAKHQQFMKGSSGKSNAFVRPRKKQRMHPTAGGDVKLSPLQKQHLKVERQLDANSRNILGWTITDSTIDDTRHFQNLMHAQEFIDECWAFISTDIRNTEACYYYRRGTGGTECASRKPRRQLSRDGNKAPGLQQLKRSSTDRPMLRVDQESPEQIWGDQQLSAQTKPVQGQRRSSHLPGAAATAELHLVHGAERHDNEDQLPTVCRQASIAERLKLAPDQRSLSRSSHGCTAICNEQASVSRDLTLVATQAAAQSDAPAAAASASPAAARTASCTASFSRDRTPSMPHPAAAARTNIHIPASAASPAASPAAASAVPRWPCNSKRMANVTELHGGTVKQPARRSKHHTAPVYNSPAAASTFPSPAGGGHPCHPSALDERRGNQRQGANQHSSSSPRAVLAQAQPDQTCHQPIVRSGRSTSSSPGSPLASLSHQPQVKLEPAELDLPSSSSTANHQLPPELTVPHQQLPCDPTQLPSHAACTHQRSPSRKRTRSPMAHAALQHTSPNTHASNPSGRPHGSGAQPRDESARQHWQLSKAPSAQFKFSPSGTAQHARSGRAHGGQPGLSLSQTALREGPNARQESSSTLPCASLSWGRRKPRTRREPRQSDDSTADLATVAATAAAEAEQAAVAAAATAHTRLEEAAHPSESDEDPASKRPCRKLNSFHSQGTAQDPSMQPGPSAKCNSTDQPREPDCQRARHMEDQAADFAESPKQGSRRQHHRAGALPSSLNKSVGYIGSTYVGVNGVKHGADHPLRWRAGTWDPVVKKTVYIGSYETEVGAAAAVDAWHMSQGREAVNFPPQPVMAPKAEPGPQQPAAAQLEAEPSQHMPNLNSHAAAPSAKSHLHQALALLKSLRPQHPEQVELAQKPMSLNQSIAAHYGCARPAVSRSQRQSAAGALVANAAGRCRTSRADGTGKARHFSHERLAASLCGRQKW